jgi:hypothetical protein
MEKLRYFGLRQSYPLAESLHIITRKGIHTPFRTDLGKYHVIMNPDFYPLYHDKGVFRLNAYKFTASTLYENIRTTADTVLVDYRITAEFKKEQSGIKKHKHEQLCEFLIRLRSRFDKVHLFDTKDSHNIIFDVLPFVDKYYKKQLLRNRDLYTDQSHWPHGRVYGDMIKPGGTMAPELRLDRPGNFEGAEKLELLWNIVTAKNHLFIPTVWDYIKVYLFGYSSGLNDQTTVKKSFSEQREWDFNGSFGLKYTSSWVTNHRVEMFGVLKKLSNRFRVFTEKLPKSEYDKMLRKSRAVVSPYGWGEVCYRDFEAVEAGALLIKPDMGHLVTNPDMYVPYETYYPLSWDTNLWEDELIEALDK